MLISENLKYLKRYIKQNITNIKKLMTKLIITGTS